jgi:hypothetical protein
VFFVWEIELNLDKKKGSFPTGTADKSGAYSESIPTLLSKGVSQTDWNDSHHVPLAQQTQLSLDLRLRRQQVNLSILRGIYSVSLVKLTSQIFVFSPVVAVLDAKGKVPVVLVFESGFESEKLLVSVLDCGPKSFDLIFGNLFGNPSFGPGASSQIWHSSSALLPLKPPSTSVYDTVGHLREEDDKS